jgi:hypothetical protein
MSMQQLPPDSRRHRDAGSHGHEAETMEGACGRVEHGGRRQIRRGQTNRSDSCTRMHVGRPHDGIDDPTHLGVPRVFHDMRRLLPALELTRIHISVGPHHLAGGQVEPDARRSANEAIADERVLHGRPFVQEPDPNGSPVARGRDVVKTSIE